VAGFEAIIEAGAGLEIAREAADIRARLREGALSNRGRS
jgi:hypothetical protein